MIMNSIEKIKNGLPSLQNQNGNVESEMENPYKILLDFAEAVTQKYKPIYADVSEISTISSKSDKTSLGYVFYINAPIDRGYYYRLFEVIPQKEAFYPVKIKLFGDKSIDQGLAQSDEELQTIILEKIFNSTFVKQLFSYIISNVNLKRTIVFTKQNKKQEIPFEKSHKTLILRELEAQNKNLYIILDLLKIHKYFQDGAHQSNLVHFGAFYTERVKLGTNIIKFGSGESEDKNSTSQITIPINCIKIEIEYERDNNQEILDEIYLRYSLI
jgi:hypothetical protein